MQSAQGSLRQNCKPCRLLAVVEAEGAKCIPRSCARARFAHRVEIEEACGVCIEWRLRRDVECAVEGVGGGWEGLPPFHTYQSSIAQGDVEWSDHGGMMVHRLGALEGGPC